MGRSTAARQAPQPNRADLLNSIAVADTRSGIRFRDGRVSTIYNPDDLAGRQGLRIYDTMRTDEQVKAAMGLKKAAMIGPGWKLDPVSESTEDLRIAELIKDDLDRLPGTLESQLFEVLTALDYGFSLTEQIYRLDGGQLRLDRLQTIAPHGVTFEQSDDGTLGGFRQLGSDQTILPMGKFLHFANDLEFANPYGQSDLRAAHRPWWHKSHWTQWFAVWGEKLADAPIVINSPKGASDTEIAQARKSAENLQARSVMTVPEGWAITMLEVGRDVEAVFVAAIDRHDMSIARAVLVPEKLGLAGGSVEGGSFSLSQTQLGAFFFVIDLKRGLLESCFQEQVINRQAALLNPNADPPHFELLPTSDEDKEEIAKTWAVMVTGGMPETPKDWQHTRSLLGYPELSDEEIEEAQEEPEPAPPVPPTNQPPPLENPPVDDDTVEASLGTLVPAPSQARNGMPFWRALRPTEARLDLVARLQEVETGAQALGVVLGIGATALATDLRDKTARLLSKGLTPEGIRKLGASKRTRGKLTKGVRDHLREDFATGVRSAEADVAAALADTGNGFVQLTERLTLELADGGLTESAAQRFFAAKAFWITGIVEDDLLTRSQGVLFNAMRGDKPDRVVLLELDEILAPHLPTRDAAGRAVNIPHRLETIARTNTAEALNEGRFQFFQDPDVAKAVPLLEYSAILDSRVRANHRAWDGVRKPVAWWLGPPDRRAPNGFNSFVPDTRVSGDFEAGSKARYAGPVVKLHTRNGSRLTVTVNHPILTRRGFVPAHGINEGDQLVVHTPTVESLVEGVGEHRIAPPLVTGGTIDHEQIPPRIEDVFEAFVRHATAATPYGIASTTPLDFHGDARNYHGDVHIVGADGLLPARFQSQLAEAREQLGLMMGNGSPLQSGPACSMEHAACSVGIGRASDWNAPVNQALTNGRTRGVELLGNPQFAHAAGVEFDDVVHVEIGSYVGHVYDLQSPNGWIVANGIVASNCRCLMVPITQAGIVLDGATETPDEALPSVAVTDPGFK